MNIQRLLYNNRLMLHDKRLLITYMFILLLSNVIGQKNTSIGYIDLFKDLAIKEMTRTGIPASITLAQGMLESGNGNSRLAVKGNNHFGIKCHNNWEGGRIYHDDDRRNECFRKYNSVYESYIDHSDFLVNTSRYAFLFELKQTDYKGWAKGLKKAGYATTRDYDRKLIGLIEEYELYKFDKEVPSKKPSYEREDYILMSDIKHEIKTRNEIKYILAVEGDTYNSLTEEFDLLKWQIARYNDISQNDNINAGDIIYLQPKRKKAAHGNKIHIVKEGETMYFISQLYGIKLNELYKKNLMMKGMEPQTGNKLNLRKRKKGEMPVENIENGEQNLEFRFD